MFTKKVEAQLEDTQILTSDKGERTLQGEEKQEGRQVGVSEGHWIIQCNKSIGYLPEKVIYRRGLKADVKALTFFAKIGHPMKGFEQEGDTSCDLYKTDMELMQGEL